MHNVSVIGEFKTDYDAYVLLKKQTYPEVTLVSDKDKQKKIIKWVPLFDDALPRPFGSKGTLVYIAQENSDFPDAISDPLMANEHYYASGSMLEELNNRLPHEVSIFRDDNKNVFIMIVKAVSGTSVNSTINSYSIREYF